MRLPTFVMFFLVIIITIAALPCRVLAASFTDDMIISQNTSVAQYSGLKPYPGATYGLSDQTLLTFSNNSSPQGYALYRVNGAESITVGIYTYYGTCVSQKENDLLLSRGTKQALWSKSEDAVYSDFGGSFWRIELDLATRYDPVFSPVNSLAGDVAGFGLNIYASPGSAKPLSAFVTKSVAEELCYEEYTAAIPSGAQYVKVEINSVTSYPLKGGGTMPNRIYTSLASVTLSGNALVMGEPAKTERQAVAGAQATEDDADDEVTKISGGTLAAKELPAEPEFDDDAGASSEKASSSKFEGTITSSSRQEKSQASKDEAQSDSSKESKLAESSAKGESARETVYEIRRESGGDGMSSGVTVYIIIVSGALALLLIFGKKR